MMRFAPLIDSVVAHIAGSEFNPHPGHVVASLDKTLYDNYLCLVASNKQQIYEGRGQNVNRKAWKMVNS